MVRTSHLKGFVFLALLVGSSVPARAETPLDWYIELKREAKYARIAASGGASVRELAPYSDAAARLIARIEGWDSTRVSVGARPVCLVAAQNLQIALQRGTSDLRHTAIRDGEPKRDACLAAIQGR